MRRALSSFFLLLTLGVLMLWGQEVHNPGSSGAPVACATCLTATAPTNHGVLLGSGTQAVGVTAAGATNTLLHGNTGANPNYSAVVDADLSGQVGLAHGGTNVDLSAAGSATNILAIDGSHVVNARNLVAADIPSLAASKITTGQIGLAQGGTNADLSGTGGTSQFLKQASVGAAVTVVRPACADLSDSSGGCTMSTTAGGDLSGTLPSPTVAKANGNTFPASVALGDTLYGSGASAISKLAGPTATNSVPQYMMETPSGGLAVAPAWSTLPVPYNAQTGTTYTIAATDRSSYVSISNASSIAVTLPQANTTGFANKFSFWIRNIGAGNLTITPTTSTIDGNATKTVAQGGACLITSDDTNYFTICDSGVVTTGSPLSKTVSVSGVQINCTTCVNDPGTAVDSTALGADVAVTTALATGASGAGVYRISVVAAVTRVGTTSTLPTTCITWTERNSSQALNLNTTASSTGNALTTFAQAELVVNAKASTNIQYATGANCTGGTTYASTGGTTMQYDLSVRVTALP